MSEEESDYSYDSGEGSEEVVDEEMKGESVEIVGTPVKTSATLSSHSGSIQIASESDIENLMRTIIEKVTMVTQLNSRVAHIALDKFNWDANEVNQRFFDGKLKVPIATFADSPVFCSLAAPSLCHVGGKEAEEEQTCDVCLDDKLGSSFLSVGCDHYFCTECWANHLTALAEGEVEGILHAKCLEAPCGCIVPKQLFTQLTPAMVSKIEEKELSGFVARYPGARWCINPKCSLFSLFSPGTVEDVHCHCGTVYCSKCGTDAHRPASCDAARKWAEKNSAQSESTSWILAFTKQCPKCNSPIEKAHGCNHMTCWKCRHHFCWMCLGAWDKHGPESGGFYRCNKYEATKDDPEELKKREGRDQIRLKMKRYLHYFEHFHNHLHSVKLGNSITRRRVCDLIEALTNVKNFSPFDLVFLQEALTQVIECHRVLAWTYVVVYYLPEGREKELAEHIQTLLEANVDALHEKLARTDFQKYLDIDSPEQADFFDFRSDVVNRIRVNKKFLQQLLVDFENGLIDKTVRGLVVEEPDIVDSAFSGSATAPAADGHGVGGGGGGGGRGRERGADRAARGARGRGRARGRHHSSSRTQQGGMG